MKVFIGPGANPSIGGMARVYEGLVKYLPCEIVKTIDEADVVNPHIGIWWDVPSDKPIVLSNHGLYWMEDAWGNKITRDNQNGINAVLQADVVTVPSQFVQKVLGRITLVKALVVHHGIDVNEWLPADSEGYVLWNKARVDPANDPRIVNALAELLPDIQFVTTFGDPAPNVQVIGKVNPEDMKDLVAHAGVYLATARESGGPCFGILEAMSCGVPVVSLNWGGTAEVIEQAETGFLGDDLQELAVGIPYCLENRDRLGANCRQLVIDRYQWKDTILGYVKAYEEALKAPPIKASIIIPCYNLGDYVGAAIESALNQDFDNFEVIVVNDASTDNSVEVIERYRGKVTIIHNEENLHVSDSRNRAVHAARGKYILPLDADDTLEPDALKNMVPELEQDRSLHMVAGRLNVTDGQKWWINAWPSAQPIPEEQMKGHNQIPYSTLYRRQMWLDLGGYRRRIRTGIEDADFWMRAFSYGRKGKLIEQATLNYARRDGSLGRSHNTTGEDWLKWYAWYYKPELRPTEWLYANDPPVISVIIPVGPGHLHHIQACLDSLVAQTFPYWEAVVINDSGEDWGQYIEGFPFVTFVPSAGKGVSFARNTGVLHARADRVVFLDVDDIAQPDMLEVLYDTHRRVDGWVYGDWYTNGVADFSKDWSAAALWGGSLGPITGIYWKKDVLDAFDTQAPGWEDWDLHLKLAEKGIGGTRLAYPIFTYNKHLGGRREENFANKNNLLEYIWNQHDKEKIMGCCGKGGKSTVKVNPAAPKTQPEFKDDEFVQMVYTGPEKNKQGLRSKINPKMRYVYSAFHPQFPAYRQEVPRLLEFPYFKLAQVESPKEVKPMPVLQADTPHKNIPLKTPITFLQLDMKVTNMLLTQFSSIEDLMAADDADVLTIKGIGEARLKEIREEIDRWNSGSPSPSGA